jgi:glucose-1-phosphate adenylyltransferase
MKPARLSPIARDAMAYVLAGGRGSRLMELTDKRAKPAVYFGGKSRIVDFAVSNAYNSGIRHIAVATQYKAHSLIRHLHRAWNFLRPIRNESFDVLPASQRVSESLWYLGTADAVYQNIDIIESYNPKYFVVLAGDHVYKMDYEHMLRQHVDQNADVTVACIEVPCSEATGFGVMDVDEDDVIKSFIEKPKNPPSMPGKPGVSLASMGIYVFETKFLLEELRRDAADPASSHDFGKDIIPHLVENGKAVAHSFERSCVRSESESGYYWRDVGTIDAYWAANVDLTAVVPELDIYDQNWPIWTYNEVTPPAKFVHDEDGRRGLAISSLVSGSCIVSGATIRRTLLSTGARVNSFASVENAVILPYVEVCRSARLKNVVIDAGVKIPEGLVVGEDPELDAKRFRRTDRGICLITQPMIDRLRLPHANGHTFESAPEEEDEGLAPEAVEVEEVADALENVEAKEAEKAKEAVGVEEAERALKAVEAKEAGQALETIEAGQALEAEDVARIEEPMVNGLAQPGGLEA